MPYTANSARDRSADYLQQSMANLTQTIERNRQEREKKEQEKKAKEAVMAAGTALYGEGFDLKDAPQETWGQVIQLAQAKKDEPMRQLAAENAALRQKIDQAELARINAAAEQVSRNRSAVGNAMGAPWADGSAAAQVQRAAAGGADAPTLQQLSAMAENLAQAQQRTQPRPGPMETTFGGVPAVVANGNVQFIPQPKPPAAPRGLAVEIQQLRTAQQQAQAAGDQDLADALETAIVTKSTGADDISLMQLNASRRARRNPPGGNPPPPPSPDDKAPTPTKAPGAPTGAKLSPADQQALDWANANPTDPRAKRIKDKLGIQ